MSTSKRVIARSVVPILLAVTASGCAARQAVHWDRPPAMTPGPSVRVVFVMEPIVVGTAAPGNTGRDFAAIKAGVVTRILSAVRERFPQAEIADSRSLARVPTLPAYRLATGETEVTREEMNAASRALERGATHLLVPTITEWTQMRTDDPIGVFTLPRNSVTVTLRLMRLEPPALAGRVTFRNRARLTLNQQAIRLLNDRFRDVTLRLVSGT